MITLDFTTLVRNQVTAIQALAANALDFAIGSVLRALIESNSSIVIWLQSLILQLLATTRAATSFGADLDSWMADYGVTRISAVPAVGIVTFARFTSSQAASIPVGYVVETQDGNVKFVVTLDSTLPTYNVLSNSYIVGSGINSIDVPVEAVVSGTSGNVIMGGINTLTQSLVGIDTVTNGAAFITGVDAESDDNLRARFVLYLASLAKATKNALEYALASLQSGIQYQLLENQDRFGVPTMGAFVAVIDDGTGSPSDELVASAYNALDEARPFTSTFIVIPPDVATATIILTLPGASSATKLAVKNALINAVNSLGLGNSFSFSLISIIAYNNSSIVANSVSLNGGILDLSVTDQQTIKTDNAHVTVN